MRKLVKRFIKYNKKRIEECANSYKLPLEQQIWKIFDFYVARAKGDLFTSSEFQRNFVKNHSNYK